LIFRVVPALLAAVFLAAGCTGTTTSRQGADISSGKQLFTQKCGSCHTLKDAGTQGVVGPNLDNAFGYARSQKFDSSTFFEVTLHQMRIPSPPMPDFDEPGTKDYLSDEDLIAIANYVASCAGEGVTKGQVGQGCTGGGGPSQGTDGKSLFAANGCGSCHTLKDAGSTGAVGPNLDEAKPPKALVINNVTNGAGAMPAFGDKLSKEQIQAIADYVVKVTGG
jgi:mono/diheme cytochrome c family protein